MEWKIKNEETDSLNKLADMTKEMNSYRKDLAEIRTPKPVNGKYFIIPITFLLLGTAP